MEKNMVLKENKHYSTVLMAAGLLLFTAVNFSSLGFANFNIFGGTAAITKTVKPVHISINRVERPKVSRKHGIKPFTKMSEKKLKQLSASIFLILADKRNY